MTDVRSAALGIWQAIERAPPPDAGALPLAVSDALADITSVGIMVDRMRTVAQDRPIDEAVAVERVIAEWLDTQRLPGDTFGIVEFLPIKPDPELLALVRNELAGYHLPPAAVH